MLDKTTKRTRNGLTFAERAAIADTLAGIVTKDGQFAVYAPGWNDAQAAKAAAERFGRDVTAANVAYVRKQVFGVVRTVTPAAQPKADTLEARVARLEADLDRLRSALGAW